MLLTSLRLPFIGSLCTRFARWLGPSSYVLAVYAIVVDLVLFNLIAGERLSTNSWLNLVWFRWLDCGALTYAFELTTSPLRLAIAYVVVTVRTLVHCYSLWYLAGDPHQPRFFGLISLFTGFILLLVHAGDLSVVFLGWEGIGVISYLLIRFWYTRINAIQ